jgi:hypothetical protein
MSKRREEKAKLAASFINSSAITLLNLGGLAPLFAFVFNVADFRVKISFLNLTLVFFFVTLIVYWLFKQASKQLDKLPDDK